MMMLMGHVDKYLPPLPSPRAGVHQGVGVPQYQTSGAQYFSGAGGSAYVGTGISSWVESPFAQFAGMVAFFGNGGNIATDCE